MIKKNIDYVYINSIKHLLRNNEEVVAVCNTKTVCPHLKDKGKVLYYKLVGTQNRILIVAKDFEDEFSTSYGISEIKEIRINKGVFKDSVKFGRETFKLNKKDVRNLLSLSDFTLIKIRYWKYPILLCLLAILIGAAYQGYLYIQDIHPTRAIRLINRSGNTNRGSSAQRNTTQNTSQTSNSNNSEMNSRLLDVVSGYEFSLKSIIKNYPLYLKNPSMTGEPSLHFDTWASREIIGSLDAQELKLNSLTLTAAKHVIAKQKIEELKLAIIKYLDYCKKSFKTLSYKKKMKTLRKSIFKSISKLKSILK